MSIAQPEAHTSERVGILLESASIGLRSSHGFAFLTVSHISATQRSGTATCVP